jgi:hypothetical protein
MNSRFNAVPVIVQQMVESLMDKNTSTNIRFNHSTTITTIRDYCDQALKDYEKQSMMKRNNPPR